MLTSTSAAPPKDIPSAEIAESTKSPVVTIVNSEEGLIKLEPCTATPIIVGEDEIGNDSSFAKYTGPSIAERLLKDQLDRVHSLADTHIVCDDGHVPFHRIFLMAASAWLSDLLWTEDPSELTVIHLPDVKVVNVVQVLFLLYCGEAAYKKADEPNIFTIFQLLQISTNGFESRISRTDDPGSNVKLRFYKNLLQDDEAEFIPSFLRNDDSEILTVNDISNSSLEENNVCRSDTSDVIIPSKSQSDIAEKNAVVPTSDIMKCLNCNIIIKTELEFSSHLSTTCGSCLAGKYSYADKECFGCHEKFPSYSLYRLINHVETCKNLEAAFSCKEAFFVVNSGPKKVIEDVQIEAELSQEVVIDLPAVQTNNKKGSNRQEETTGRQKRRGRKRRKSGKQKNAIKIVDIRELAEKDTGNKKSATSINEDELLQMEEDETQDIQVIDEDIILEEPVLYSPSKKRTRHNSTMSLRSSQSICAEIRPQSSNAIVIPDFGKQEEVECAVENDISTRTTQDLRLFLTCPVCKVSYRDIKAASKCQRKHGLKRCWVCVKSLPCNPDIFINHIVSKHVIPDTNGRVNCAFCPKQFDYTGIAIHMGHYHFPKLFKPKERKNFKGSISVTEMKTPQKGNRGNVKVSTENSSLLSTPSLDCSREEIEEIIISDYSDASQDSSYISSANAEATTNFVPADNDVEVISIEDDDPQFSGNQQPERRNSIKNRSPTAKTAGKLPTLPTPPKLGRVLLETKEIDGLSYNIYGLPNPTGADRRNKFSKVIAIRNTDSQSNSIK